MALIHLEPDIIYMNITQAKRAVDDISALISSISSTSREMSGYWQGASADDFQSQNLLLLKQLETSSINLSGLIAQWEAEVSQWEEVDRSGVGRLSQEGDFIELLNTLPYSGGVDRFDTLKYLSIPYPIIRFLPSILDLILPEWLRDAIRKILEAQPAATPDVIEAPSPVDIPEVVEEDVPSQEGQAEPGAPVTEGEAAQEKPEEQKPAREAVEPVPAPRYSVPVKEQGTQYGNKACSATSVSMILDYYHQQNPDHKTISTGDLINSMDPGDGSVKTGISVSNLEDEIHDLGYGTAESFVDTTAEDLRKALNDGPVIVVGGVNLVGPGTIHSDVPRDALGAGNIMHAMVVTGISEDGSVYYLNDPWSGKQISFTSDVFMKMWAKGKNGMFVIRP